ncbi:hypothetical protein NE701_15410, partial [Coprococcus eutactus]|nr:hypothetical protein [Coprococcus eutactus]
ISSTVLTLDVSSVFCSVVPNPARPGVPGNAASQVIGNLQTADFINPAGLQAVGNNLFLETAASGAPQVGTPG